MSRLALAGLAALSLCGCGGGDGEAAKPPPESTPRAAPPAAEAPLPTVRRLRCPPGLRRCRSVTGPVLYVESVDPDGDGDLHVVVIGGNVTALGLTAVDVRKGLRPRRDPRLGDRVSAAGQVQPGSFGQKQIHAVEFAVAGNPARTGDR